MNIKTTSAGRGHRRLYLIVSVSGAVVLSVEPLGTRVLGPFYGVSLFLWSALISVPLAALSAGYAIGGTWADRSASLSRLGDIRIVLARGLIAGSPSSPRPVAVPTTSGSSIISGV